MSHSSLWGGLKDRLLSWGCQLCFFIFTSSVFSWIYSKTIWCVLANHDVCKIQPSREKKTILFVMMRWFLISVSRTESWQILRFREISHWLLWRPSHFCTIWFVGWQLMICVCLIIHCFLIMGWSSRWGDKRHWPCLLLLLSTHAKHDVAILIALLSRIFPMMYKMPRFL